MRLKNFNLATGAQLMKALGDPSRVRILNLLYLREHLTISDLEFILDFTQTKTSRHIMYLKHAGMLVSHKLDQWVIYDLKEEAIELIGRFHAFVEKDVQLLKDLKTYDTLFSNRELSLNKIEPSKWKKIIG